MINVIEICVICFALVDYLKEINFRENYFHVD